MRFNDTEEEEKVGRSFVFSKTKHRPCRKRAAFLLSILELKYPPGYLKTIYLARYVQRLPAIVKAAPSSIVCLDAYSFDSWGVNEGEDPPLERSGLLDLGGQRRQLRHLQDGLQRLLPGL